MAGLAAAHGRFTDMKNALYKRILAGLLALCIAAPSYAFPLLTGIVSSANIVTSPWGVSSTFDPAAKGAGVILSGANLTATINSTTYDAVRSTTSHATSGKYQAEFTINTTNYVLVGIETSSSSLTNYVGSEAISYGYLPGTGRFFHAGAFTTTATAAVGDVIGMVFDASSGTLTFYKNGISLGVAATGITGTYFAAMSGSSSPVFPYGVTANFGATAFAFPK